MPKIYLLLCLSLWACQTPIPGNPQPSPSNNPSASPTASVTPGPSASPTASPSAVPTPSNDPAGFALGETFSLNLNQKKQAAAEAISVQFLAVLEDSRCPSDVTCIWAGEVKVSLALSKNQAAAEEKEILMSGGAESAQIKWEGYTIELLDVAPYPKSDQITTGQNVIQLRITQAK